MPFAFDCAKQLYARGLHPRLLMSPDDLPRLRRQVRSGDGRKIMNALRTKVRWLTQNILDAGDLGEFLAWRHHSWSDPGVLALMALDDIALVGALDEQEEAVEAVRRVLAVLCRPERKGEWLGASAIPYDLIRPRLSPEENAGYTRAVADAVRALVGGRAVSYFKQAGSNLVLTKTLDALPLLLAIQGEPGVPDLSDERRRLILMLDASFHATTNPDGYPEEDMGYGTAVSSYLSRLGEIARRAGLYDLYSRCPRFRRFGRAVLHFVQPWGEDLSNTGDHGDDFKNREFVLARLASETRDPAVLWLLGTLGYDPGRMHPHNSRPDYDVEVPLRRGFRTPASADSLLVLDELKGERHPSRARVPTAFRDRGRGIVSFRSGWDPDATFVVFDGSRRSPSAQGHFHASAGHFSLSALGEYFSIDTGRYNTEQSQHSVVLIDGRSGRDTGGIWSHHMSWQGLLTDYRPGAFVDYAAVDSSLQHNCFWARRHLGLVKGRGAPAYVWTVDDINKANDWAEYWWQLQTSPENVIATRAGGATITGWRHGHRLDVHFALPAVNEYPKPHALEVTQDVCATSSHRYVSNAADMAKTYRRPSDMVHGPCYIRPRLIAKVTGYNGRFMSVMIPRRRGDRPARVERIESIPNSLALQITFPDVQDTLIFAYEHLLLEAGEAHERGPWCVIRRSRKSGRVTARELGGDPSR